MMNACNITAWMSTHKKKLGVHCTIVASFMLYAFIFQGLPLAKPLAIEGEARLCNIRLPEETNDIGYGFEQFAVGTYALETEGWAFVEGGSGESNAVYLVLRSDKHTYVFDTETIVRSDLTSGFTAVIQTRKIETGEYVVGFCIKENGAEALEYTDRILVKPANAVEIASVAPSR